MENKVIRLDLCSRKELNEYLMSYRVPENVIDDQSYRVDWKIVSEHQDLSEGFIWKFKDSVDWEKISQQKKLYK